MNYDRIEDDQWLDRFEPDGEDFVFRRTLRSPGVRVTRDQLDQLLEDRKPRKRAQDRVLLAVGLPTLIACIFAKMYFHIPENVAVWVTVAIVAVVIFFAVRRGSGAERLAMDEWVRDKPVVAPAYSKEEALNVHFQRATWSRMGTYAAILIFGMLGAAARSHWLNWNNRFWIIGFVIFFSVLFAAAAFRKWRWSRTGARNIQSARISTRGEC